MTSQTPETDLFGALDSLLERERAALIQGHLTDLPELLSEKETLLDQIAGLEGAERHRIESLQGKALRNQSLLDSALLGIRNVASRFATLRRIRKTLETYDEFGQKTALPTAPESKVEKRA